MASDGKTGKFGPRLVPKPPTTNELLDRQPPADMDAEVGVLGSILIMPEAIDEVALLLRSEDFYGDANQRLYRQLTEMHDAGMKIDITLLSDRLRATGDFEEIGGAAYLGRLINAVPHAAHAAFYAKIVAEKSTLRGLIHAGTDIIRDAYDETREVKEVVGEAEQKILSIQDSRGNTEVPSIRKILHLSMDRIDARIRGE